MNEEIQDPERVAAAYRRAGQECAQYYGHGTATVIYAGATAEMVHRWGDGNSGRWANGAEATVELLLGDVLGSRAAQELNAIAALRISDWTSQNWQCVIDRAQSILATESMQEQDPELMRATGTQREQCYARSAMEVAAASGDIPACELAYVAACAAARYRGRHRWEALTAEERDELLAATTLGDPVWVTGRAELPAWRQRKTPHWVWERWGQVEAGAETLLAAQESLAPANSTQRIAIARHEVRQWLAPHGVHETFTAYGQAAAEGLVYWDTSSDDLAAGDDWMQCWADEVEGHGLTDEQLAQFRQMIRNRWEQLAPPPWR